MGSKVQTQVGVQIQNVMFFRRFKSWVGALHISILLLLLLQRKGRTLLKV